MRTARSGLLVLLCLGTPGCVTFVTSSWVHALAGYRMRETGVHELRAWRSERRWIVELPERGTRHAWEGGVDVGAVTTIPPGARRAEVEVLRRTETGEAFQVLLRAGRDEDALTIGDVVPEERGWLAGLVGLVVLPTALARRGHPAAPGGRGPPGVSRPRSTSLVRPT